MEKAKLVVLTGAGMSAESGIRTFRDSDGLWEEYRVEEVATPEAWARNPELVQRFYNERRKQLYAAQPNPGHLALAEAEQWFEVHIVTQNIDDLHERAGSSRVLHLHGELKKAQSVRDASLVQSIEGWELKMGDVGRDGAQLRPHIVWFGEGVPNIEPASRLAMEADIFAVVGTSLNVYPAAGLTAYVRRDVPIYVVDPKPVAVRTGHEVTFIRQPASTGIPELIGMLRQ